MKPSCILRLYAAEFRSSAACRGEQIAAVVMLIGGLRANLVWYVADVEGVGPALVERNPKPTPFGDSVRLATAAAAVSQFERGVFIGVPTAIACPQFRNGGLWTEDDDDADLGDAVVEVRAFDTTYVLVATVDAELAEAVTEAFSTREQSERSVGDS